MKGLNKIVSSVVLVCFAINTISTDLAYALGPGLVSGALRPGGSDVREKVYAGGQKLFGAKHPSRINFKTPQPTHVIGDAPELRRAFLVSDGDLSGYLNQLGSDPIYRLYRTFVGRPGDGFIYGLEYFMVTQTGISNDVCDVREAYYDVEDKGQGELPIARLLAPLNAPTSRRMRLEVHTDFVRRWSDINNNDLKFFYTFPHGPVKAVSLAEGILYRVARHEMTELDGKGLPHRGLGHMMANPRGEILINRDELVANAISGRYSIVNDAIWLWFLASYCYGDKLVKYDNREFKRRIKWIFESAEARKMKLPLEFPNLIKDDKALQEAIDLALWINYHFYKSYNETPVTKQDEERRANLVQEYRNRVVAHGEESHALYATGAGDQSPGTPAGKNVVSELNRAIRRGDIALASSFADQLISSQGAGAKPIIMEAIRTAEKKYKLDIADMLNEKLRSVISVDDKTTPKTAKADADKVKGLLRAIKAADIQSESDLVAHKLVVDFVSSTDDSGMILEALKAISRDKLGDLLSRVLASKLTEVTTEKDIDILVEAIKVTAENGKVEASKIIVSRKLQRMVNENTIGKIVDAIKVLFENKGTDSSWILALVKGVAKYAVAKGDADILLDLSDAAGKTEDTAITSLIAENLRLIAMNNPSHTVKIFESILRKGGAGVARYMALYVDTQDFSIVLGMFEAALKNESWDIASILAGRLSVVITKKDVPDLAKVIIKDAKCFFGNNTILANIVETLCAMAYKRDLNLLRRVFNAVVSDDVDSCDSASKIARKIISITLRNREEKRKVVTWMLRKTMRASSYKDAFESIVKEALDASTHVDDIPMLKDIQKLISRTTAFGGFNPSVDYRIRELEDIRDNSNRKTLLPKGPSQVFVGSGFLGGLSAEQLTKMAQSDTCTAANLIEYLKIEGPGQIDVIREALKDPEYSAKLAEFDRIISQGASLQITEETHREPDFTSPANDDISTKIIAATGISISREDIDKLIPFVMSKFDNDADMVGIRREVDHLLRVGTVEISDFVFIVRTTNGAVIIPNCDRDEFETIVSIIVSYTKGAAAKPLESIAPRQDVAGDARNDAYIDAIGRELAADTLADMRRRASQGTSVRDVLQVIDDYSVAIGQKSVVAPTPAEVAAFYPVFKELNGHTVRVFLSQATNNSLTQTLKDEISKLNQRIRERTGRTDDAIDIVPYNFNNLGTLLARKEKDGVKRIFVNDSYASSAFKSILDAESGEGKSESILCGKRVITTEIPNGKADDENSVFQAWLIKVAILSALVNESNMSTVGTTLKEELMNRVDGVDEFIGKLANTENEPANVAAVRERVNYFLGKIVKLSEFIGNQIRILKAFWTAA